MKHVLPVAAEVGKILKTDVSIAKHYLTEDEFGHLNRMVTSYLDYAESMASSSYSLDDAGLGKAP